MNVLGTAVVGSGCLLLFIGTLWFLITAFRESLLWGLGVMFVPIVPVVFLIMKWDRAKRPFMLELAGVAIVLFGSLVLKAPIPGLEQY